MSDLDFDASLTGQEREMLDAILVALWQTETDRVFQIFEAKVLDTFEALMEARLLDLAQRAEAAEATLERARKLADEWERRGSILPANQLGKPHTPAMKQAVDRLRAALDPAPATEVRDDVPHDHPAPATEDHPSIEDARLRRAIARHVCNVSNLPEPLRVAAWGLDFGDFIDGLAAAIRAHLADVAGLDEVREAVEQHVSLLPSEDLTDAAMSGIHVYLQAIGTAEGGGDQ